MSLDLFRLFLIIFNIKKGPIEQRCRSSERWVGSHMLRCQYAPEASVPASHQLFVPEVPPALPFNSQDLIVNSPL